MSIYDTFTKTQFVGATTNYTPKNRGMGFALCLCKTKAKLAIKQNDKLEFNEANIDDYYIGNKNC